MYLFIVSYLIYNNNGLSLQVFSLFFSYQVIRLVINKNMYSYTDFLL